jgi:hypothetical protein
VCLCIFAFLCAVLYCHLWPFRLYHIFPHYLINGAILGIMLFNTKCVFWFSLQVLTNAFLILRIIQRYIVINVHTFHVKCPIFLPNFNKARTLPTHFRNNTQITNLVKIRQWKPSCSMRRERQKDEQRDMTNSRFRNFENAPKMTHFPLSVSHNLSYCVLLFILWLY